MPKVEFQRCVLVDGKAYATIAEAQTALIQDIFKGTHNGAVGWSSGEISEKIVQEREQILAALTLTGSSRPAPRKAFGGMKKSRKSKTADLPGIEPKAA